MTVRELFEKNAFGEITEAEIHYDFDRAPWLHYLTAKKYTPGSGMTFGLGTMVVINMRIWEHSNGDVL